MSQNLLEEGLELSDARSEEIKGELKTLQELKVIAFVNHDAAVAQCLVDDPEVKNRLLKCLELSYGEEFTLLNEDLRGRHTCLVFEFPDESICIFPISRKPAGWTWQKLLEVVKVTRLLPVMEDHRGGNGIHIHHKI